MNFYKKVFVVDTNVLIHRPDAILSFKDSLIIIPIWVLEELDKLKVESEGRGRSARAAIRFLNDWGQKGNLQEGVRLSNGGELRVSLEYDTNFTDALSPSKMDNKIILCAKALQQKIEAKEYEVRFVSKDINARIKALSIGVKSVDYKKHRVEMVDQYEGLKTIEAPMDLIDNINHNGVISGESYKLFPNQFVCFSNEEDSKKALGRYDLKEGIIKALDPLEGDVLGISPLNIQQRMAFDLLLDDSIQLVSLIGKAGTGKTLLALAAGLKKVMEEKQYARVLLSRPIIPMGKDLGYLPGAKGDKMKHWMQPLFDNLEYIISVAHRQNLKSADHILEQKLIEVEALTYIRGRSLPKQYIIIDEAQNLSPHEVKTIVSRAGKGSKVILTGDPQQIDHPYLDAESNGLTCLVDAFKGESLAGHITLAHSERSPLAELASEIL